jgi:hypothetical protein
VHLEAAIGEHFDQVSEAQSIGDVPAYRQDDNVVLVTAVPEHGITATMAGHQKAPEVARYPTQSPFRQQIPHSCFQSKTLEKSMLKI